MAIEVETRQSERVFARLVGLAEVALEALTPFTAPARQHGGPVPNDAWTIHGCEITGKDINLAAEAYNDLNEFLHTPTPVPKSEAKSTRIHEDAEDPKTRVGGEVTMSVPITFMQCVEEALRPFAVFAAHRSQPALRYRVAHNVHTQLTCMGIGNVIAKDENAPPDVDPDVMGQMPVSLWRLIQDTLRPFADSGGQIRMHDYATLKRRYPTPVTGQGVKGTDYRRAYTTQVEIEFHMGSGSFAVAYDPPPKKSSIGPFTSSDEALRQAIVKLGREVEAASRLEAKNRDITAKLSDARIEVANLRAQLKTAQGEVAPTATFNGHALRKLYADTQLLSWFTKRVIRGAEQEGLAEIAERYPTLTKAARGEADPVDSLEDEVARGDDDQEVTLIEAIGKALRD